MDLARMLGKALEYVQLLRSGAAGFCKVADSGPAASRATRRRLLPRGEISSCRCLLSLYLQQRHTCQVSARPNTAALRTRPDAKSESPARLDQPPHSIEPLHRLQLSYSSFSKMVGLSDSAVHAVSGAAGGCIAMYARVSSPPRMMPVPQVGLRSTLSQPVHALPIGRCVAHLSSPFYH